jgi:hypothetical protein
MPNLRLVPESGAPIEITQDQAMIGRDPACDVVVSDGSVSRRHARIERRGEVWAVVDQGSANGTFLDSVRVADAGLRAGQQLRFGAVTYGVEIEGAAAATDATTPGVPMAATSVFQQPLASPAPPPPPAPPLAMTSPPPPPPPAGAPRPAGGGRFASPVPPMAAGLAPKKGRNPLVWIAVGCCGCLVLVALIAAGAVSFAFFATQEPVAAVRAQLAELRSGQTEAAYARLSEEFRSRLSPEEFESFVEHTPALRQATDSTFPSRSVDTSRAKISGVLTTPRGMVEASYELVKEGGAWRIASLTVGGQTPN